MRAARVRRRLSLGLACAALAVAGLVNGGSAVAALRPDPAFGPGGRITVAIPRAFRILSQAAAPDGAILVGGRLDTSEAFVARVTSRGRLDTRFGARGVLRIPALGTGVDALLAGLVVAADDRGRILTVQGNFMVGTELRRFTPDGRPDPAYGDGGVVRAPPASPAGIGRDGSIVFTSRTGPLTVARVTADGRADPAFGTGGVATIGPPSGTTGGFHGADVVAETIDRFGRVILAVAFTPTSQTIEYAIVRLGLDGRPDPAFGGAGYAIVRSRPMSLVAQPGGGVAYAFSGPRQGVVFPIGIGRLTEAGTPDPLLGSDGADVFIDGPTTSFPTSLVVRPDRRLVALAGNVVMLLDAHGRAVTGHGPRGARRLCRCRAPQAPLPVLDPRGRLIIDRGDPELTTTVELQRLLLTVTSR